jgi:hypothetical protein
VYHNSPRSQSFEGHNEDQQTRNLIPGTEPIADEVRGATTEERASIREFENQESEMQDSISPPYHFQEVTGPQRRPRAQSQESSTTAQTPIGPVTTVGLSKSQQLTRAMNHMYY